MWMIKSGKIPVWRGEVVTKSSRPPPISSAVNYGWLLGEAKSVFFKYATPKRQATTGATVSTYTASLATMYRHSAFPILCDYFLILKTVGEGQRRICLSQLQGFLDYLDLSSTFNVHSVFCFLSSFPLVCVWCVFAWMQVPWSMCKSQGTSFRESFPSIFMWVPGFKLGSLGFWAVPLPAESHLNHLNFWDTEPGTH